MSFGSIKIELVIKLSKIVVKALAHHTQNCNDFSKKVSEKIIALIKNC